MHSEKFAFYNEADTHPSIQHTTHILVDLTNVESNKFIYSVTILQFEK